jgi:hypothetical protein
MSIIDGRITRRARIDTQGIATIELRTIEGELTIILVTFEHEPEKWEQVQIAVEVGTFMHDIGHWTNYKLILVHGDTSIELPGQHFTKELGEAHQEG